MKLFAATAPGRRSLSSLLLLFLLFGGISKPAHAATYSFSGGPFDIPMCELILITSFIDPTGICGGGSITGSVTIPDALVASGGAAGDQITSWSVSSPAGSISGTNADYGGALHGYEASFSFDSSGQITDLFFHAYDETDTKIIYIDIGNGGSQTGAVKIECDPETNICTSTNLFLGISLSPGSWGSGGGGGGPGPGPGPGGGNAGGKDIGDPCGNPGGSTGGTNPCSIGNGNKFEEVTDYTTAGQNPLSFTRYYNRLAGDDTYAETFGWLWRSNYDRYLTISPTSVTAERADGQVLQFTNTGGVWNGDSDVDISLEYDADTSTWKLTDHDDTVETYLQLGSGQALLQKIVERNGYTQTLNYDSSQQLVTVTDSYGRILTFTYNNDGLLTQVTTPDALVLSYVYNANGMLTSVSYNTTPATQQIYTYVNNFDLASITDENGTVFASWTYDAQHRALTSQHGTGAELVTISYDSATQRTVTNALGQQSIYTFTMLQGIPKITGITRTASATVPAGTQSFTYDSNGYTASQTDWNGRVTNYVNNSFGDPVSITEAVGTPQARTTTITYGGPSSRQPVTIVAPRRTTTFTYDARGNTLTRTETDTSGGSTNGQTRTWTFTYDSTGHMLTATNPRNAVTTFTYSGNNIATVTDALNHVSQITAYTPGGLPLSMTDPNGVVTTFVYDVRNRLTSRTVGGATTSFAYDAAGNLTTMTMPDGAQLLYTYDTAHRVTSVKNNLNETINYTLDAAGDITQQQIMGAAIAKTQTAVFDSLGRMLRQVGAYNETTTFTYDANGNRMTTKDALNQTTTQGFDALNRLVSSVDPLNNTTSTAFDAQDNLASVTDPRNLTTSYTYNGFGEVIAQTSPDTGTTSYLLDAAGNRTKETDARGVVTNRTFDLLNRPLTETYPSAANDNVSYTYDAGSFGIGRLTSFTDKSGSTAFTYNARGDILTDRRTIEGKVYTTSYTYGLADHVASITYPDGRVVRYTRDAFGRTTGVTLQNVPVASNTIYKPFGPVSGLTFGNGVVAGFTYDLNYRLTGIAAQGRAIVQNLSLAYNGVHNITSMSDLSGDKKVNRSQSFTYDADYRLLTATGAYGAQTFAYDADGNRISETSTAGNKTLTSLYAYPAVSNRLQSIAGANAQTFAYDAAGNTTTSTIGKESQAFTYDARNRHNAISAKGKTVAGYTYNALGQRAVKDDGKTRTHFIYDQQGNLIAEADSTRSITKQYIYLDNLPIAQLDGNNINYIHADPLGQPQKMTDAAQRVVWDRTNEPFGETLNISGPATLNLRFPGQYFDAESGLHYNFFRTYNPQTGRYTQSDPIGLLGGINTYNYVGGNPVIGIDPYGLYSLWDFQGDIANAEISGLQGLAGLTDSLTWGASQTYRQQHGLEYADTCSTSYKVGEWAPAFIGGARLAYAGLAKTVSLLPGISGKQAVAARNSLKQFFRGYMFSNYRMPTYQELLASKGSDAAVKAGAGRTDRILNTLGAVGATGSAINIGGNN